MNVIPLNGLCLVFDIRKTNERQKINTKTEVWYNANLWKWISMMTSSNGNIFRVTGTLWTGEFPSQRPVTRSFDVFFDLRLNNRLSKQLRPRWFETPSCSLWGRCNGMETLFLKALYEGNSPVTVTHRLFVCLPGQVIEQTSRWPKIWDTMTLTWHHCSMMPVGIVVVVSGISYHDPMWNIWLQLAGASGPILTYWSPWAPFYKWHFLINFLVWKLLYFDSLNFVSKDPISNMPALF